jgi:hypothetical protein
MLWQHSPKNSCLSKASHVTNLLETVNFDIVFSTRHPDSTRSATRLWGFKNKVRYVAIGPALSNINLGLIVYCVEYVKWTSSRRADGTLAKSLNINGLCKPLGSENTSLVNQLVSEVLAVMEMYAHFVSPQLHTALS